METGNMFFLTNIPGTGLRNKLTNGMRRPLVRWLQFAAMVFGATCVLAAPSSATTFNYSYGNPYTADAQTYIHSTSNIQLYSEGTVRAWIPITGGSSEAATTPGEIVYKFDFGSDIVESANLRTNNPTFHWAYSEGHNYVYGSKDGLTWVEILDVTTPAFASANSGFFNDLLPASLLGGTELWFKAELFSFGSNVACCGAAGRNTAQHSRWDTGQGANAETFALNVNFQSNTPSPVPLPAGFPMLIAGIAMLGLIRRK
jgi:hypothetical protein